MFQKSRKLLESRGGFRSRELNTVSSQLYLVISPRTSDPSIFGQVSFIRPRTLSSVSCAPWRTRGRADSFPTIHPTATVPTCRRRRKGAVYVQPSGIWECRAATAKSTAPWNPLGFECRFWPPYPSGHEGPVHLLPVGCRRLSLPQSAFT